MRFSLYQNPQTGGAHADHQVIDAVIAQVVRAEELGYTAAFLTEHHFTGYNAYSDPLLLGSFLAARTSHIRLGFSVALPALHHPLRFAEQTSLLDVLTRGRLIVGVGSGGGPIEFSGYGMPVAERHELTDEVLDVVMAAWQHRGGEFRYDGPHFKGSFDGRILPASWRKPHPLIARAVVSDASIVSTAKRGWPVFLGRFGPQKISEQLALYRTTLGEAGHSEATVAECNRWLSMLKIVHVAETHEQAMEEIQRPLTTYLVQSSLANAADTISEDQATEQIPTFMERAMIVGSPEEVIHGLKPYQQAGVENMMLWLMIGQMNPVHVMRSLELFAREVMPAFAESLAAKPAGG